MTKGTRLSPRVYLAVALSCCSAMVLPLGMPFTKASQHSSSSGSSSEHAGHAGSLWAREAPQTTRQRGGNPPAHSVQEPLYSNSHLPDPLPSGVVNHVLGEPDEIRSRPLAERQQQHQSVLSHSKQPRAPAQKVRRPQELKHPDSITALPCPEMIPSPAGTDYSSSEVSGRGAISILQEFIQYSKGFHMPPRCPILQWSYDTRMADFSTLEFRATVAFLLEGVPHHAAGMWHQSKKIAQRDAAERALGLFVSIWGEYLMQADKRELLFQYETPSTATGGPSMPPSPESPDKGRSNQRPIDEAQVLENFCRGFQSCDAPPPQWSVKADGDMWQAFVEAELFGVVHKFSAGPCESKEQAFQSTARRVLWYLHCPGYENAFEPNPTSVVTAAKQMPAPPSCWISDATEEDALQVAERKTAIMRLQNRLQQAFARQLRHGQSVWEWSFESDPQDTGWPLLCRATVNISVVGRCFQGTWTRGQRNAQIHVCEAVSRYLDSLQEHPPAQAHLQSEKEEAHQHEHRSRQEGQVKGEASLRRLPSPLG